MKIVPQPKSRDKFERFTCIKAWVTEDNQILLLKGDKVKLLNITYDDKTGAQYVNVEVTQGWCEGMELYLSAKQFVEYLEYTFIYENITK